MLKYKIITEVPDALSQMPPIIDWFSEGLLGNYANYKLGYIVEDELFNDEGYPLPVGTKITVERIS